MVESRPTDPATDHPHAELRPITVMFCDLVGSTELSERLDPEELFEVTRSYQASCRKVVERHEGHIAQYLGDGILVYFGYPNAHDDDVQRSVRCGLEMLSELEELNTALGPDMVPVQVRIGIHTGTVVAAELQAGSSERLALGRTPIVASRLQGLAEPDTVVLSADSQRLVEGFFKWSELGTHTLKGIAEPVKVYRALRETRVRTVFELAVREGLRPLVGRQEELDLLRDRHRKAREGRGQVVRIRGEGGIGKSRLLHALRQDIENEKGTWLIESCSPRSQNTALYPVIRILRDRLGFVADEGPKDQLARLEEALEKAGIAQPENTRLLANLLSLEVGDDVAPLMISPELQRSRTQQALLSLLTCSADEKHCAIVFEDLHWVDPSTLEFLELLAERIADQRILLLSSYRPNFTPSDAGAPHITEISLQPLGEDHARLVVGQVAGGRSVPDSVVELIVEQTDGVPLFVEELTKMVIESGNLREVDGGYELVGSLEQLSIPATLASSLRARLDKLGDHRPLVQLASVLGREFDYSMLENLEVLPEKHIERGLGALVAAELLHQKGEPPAARYSFRHALIQDAAYQSLLKSVRREYHTRIANAAVTDGWSVVAEQPEFVAHHFTEAGQYEQAAEYWDIAGRQALDRSANTEVIAHLSRALELIEKLPEDRARWQRDLAVTTALAPALTAAMGYTAPEVERAYRRALDLCEQIGDAPEHFWVLWGLGTYHQASAHHRETLETSRRMMPIAESRPELEAEVHFGLGTSLFYLGRLTEAREELEAVGDFFSSQPDGGGVSPSGHHAGVVSLMYLAMTLWLLGHHDLARARCEEGIALARRISHPFSIFISLHWATYVTYMARDRAATRAHAEEASKLSTEYGFPFGEASSGMTLAWLSASEGNGEAIDRLEEGIAGCRAAGLRGSLTHFLSMLADACLTVGKFDAGLAAVQEGLSQVETSEERAWEADLLRIRGELLADRDAEAAESSFRLALEVARSQKALSLELRTAVALGGLWRRQGKAAEARGLVSDVCDSFSQPSDTPDFRDATRLLDEP